MRSTFALLAFSIAVSSHAQTFSNGLVITVPGNSRSPIRIDPVEHAFLKNPALVPAEGEKIGNDAWAKVAPNAEGFYSGRGFQNGYAYFEVDSPTAKPAILDAVGHSMVYVNGEPRGGDVYMFGYVGLPVQLKAGKNRFLFAMGRGSLRAKLTDPPAPISFDLRDATTPDAIEGVRQTAFAGVILRNALSVASANLTVESVSAKGAKASVKISPLQPTTYRKVAINLLLDGSDSYTLRVKDGRKTLHEAKISIRVRKPGQPYKVTFQSEIDGSVQYYGVNPSSQPANGQALFLSLHGASVEAIGQAEAYASKSWGTLVAPTNRRPFGFDWEDIGRLDALEVLQLALDRFKSDPAQTYLTGHSMGGHGTWQVGAHFPDKFAAIAPSAGWISFWTYAGGATFQNPTPLTNLIRRSMNASDTLKLKHNYAQQAIYTIHGDADDNVPVAQARTMRTELQSFHKDFDWYEQPGAGHWWENSDEPGAECVDWAPAFQMFARRRVPASNQVRNVDFSTVSPGVSASCHWVTVSGQESMWDLSRVQLRADPWSRRIEGTTQNVSRLRLRMDALSKGASVTLKLDGTSLSNLPWPQDGHIHLRKVAGSWVVATPSPASEKNERRYGGFKDVFKNRVVFVYGTTGSPDEISWSKAKARFDAETFAYRGNGSVDVIADTEFIPEKFKDRNVLAYGNYATNGAIRLLVASDVIISPNELVVGQKTIRRSDLAVFSIHPRRDSDIASVGIIGGTGIEGMRLTERTPIFLSGASMPDLLVMTPSALLVGPNGALAAGFYGQDWTARNGDVVWQQSE